MAQVRTASISAAAAVLLLSVAPVFAQAARQEAAQDRTYAFDLKAQSMRSALDRFSQITGMNVMGEVAIPRKLRAPALTGAMTPQQALTQLFQGTNIRFKLTGATSVMLEDDNIRNARAQAAVQLEEITIHGEKANRTAAETTTSVGVVTGQRIEQEQIRDIHEAINSTANAISTRAVGGNSGITIRGINSEGLSQNQSANSAPVIAVIVDGAVQNTETVRRGVRSVWDVEQVEVLRGPQSTLQGRNATAGAVFVKTRDPTFNWYAAGEQIFGTHDLSSTGLTLSGPLVANELAFRLAGQMYRSNMDILYTDPRNNVLGEDRFENARGKLLWTPSALPGLRALLTFAHTDDRPGRNSVTGPNYFDRVYREDSGFIDYRNTKTNNYIADISYSLSPAIQVRSVTSFAQTNTDINSAPGAPFYLRDDERKGGDFTQDLRLEIENSGNGLSGVAGLYYGQFTTRTNSRILFDGLPGLLPGLQTLQRFTSNNETKSLAAYADAKYRIDRFAFIFGGRALQDGVGSTMVGTLYDPTLFFIPPFTGYAALNDRTSETFNRFLPKLGATYDVTPNQTVGFTYSQGYRQGFADYFPFQGPFFGIYRVQPETLDAYEVSYRSRWLDDTLQFNANVFYYDYTNQQVAFEPPGTLVPGYAVITNARKSHSYGAEFETRYRFTDKFTAYASVGLLKSHFDDIVIPATGNFSGNQFPEAPGYSVNVGGLYQDPLGWFAGANARFIDGFYSYGDLANTPARHVDNAVVVDARVGWEFKNPNALPLTSKLTLFAKNLFDERYLTYISNPSAGVRTAGVGDSRQFGLQLSVKY